MLDNIRKILYNISVNKERGNTPKELKMIRLKKSQTEPHKANAIDKRAIHNLISHLQWEIKRDGLNITADWLTATMSLKFITSLLSMRGRETGA